MSGKFNFIEVEPEDPCWYCGRRKLSASDKFYKVFVGDNDIGMVICELCKGGFSTRYIEGSEKSYATHLAFYVKRSLFELRGKLPDTITAELNSAIEDYENGEFSSSFRSIGLVAEWLTAGLFTKQFGEELARKIKGWEDRLGRLLRQSRMNKDKPEETIIFQLFSLKWFRNIVDHPSQYRIKGEDVRLGLMSIMYLLHQTNLYKLI